MSRKRLQSLLLTGKIIQSGMSSDFMKEDFYEFCNIINNAHIAGRIEEKLDE